MELGHAQIICKSSRGVIYIVALIWTIWFVRVNKTKIIQLVKKAIWLLRIGIPLLLIGLFLDLWGEFYPIPHPIKEFGEIILTNTGIAIILLSLAFLLTEVSRTSRRHKKEAETDHLTGLFNRRVFFDEAERILNEAKAGKCKLVIAIVDVDNLKKINDSKGHQYGDEALKLVGQAIKKSIRECDVSTRYGGDEFAIIFSDCGPHLENLQLRLQKHLGAAHIDREHMQLSISLGMAMFPEDGRKVDELLNIADTRMYSSKIKNKQ